MAAIDQESTDTVWVSLGVTKNLGNYESLRIDAGARRVVHADQSREDVWSGLWEEIDSQVETKLIESSQGVE